MPKQLRFPVRESIALDSEGIEIRVGDVKAQWVTNPERTEFVVTVPDGVKADDDGEIDVDVITFTKGGDVDDDWQGSFMGSLVWQTGRPREGEDDHWRIDEYWRFLTGRESGGLCG